MANNSLEFRDSLGSGSVVGPATATTALAANSARTGFMIQNQSTNILYVNFGAVAADSSHYIAILKACTGTADGTGGSLAMMDGNVYRGAVTVGGTSPSYSILEL